MPIMFAKLLALATLVVTATSYPLYKQCDARWTRDRVGGTCDRALCQGGAMITSVAMVLADCGKQIDGALVTPKTLNQWLYRNGHGGCVFAETSVSKFGLEFVGSAGSMSEIENSFRQGKAVILNLNPWYSRAQWWALMTGISGRNYLINDPGQNR